MTSQQETRREAPLIEVLINRVLKVLSVLVY